MGKHDIRRNSLCRYASAGVIATALLSAGCATTTGVDNSAGRSTKTLDITRPGMVAGVGIEAQDIVSMTDAIVRSMLANPRIANRTNPPQIILDDTAFSNESTNRINKKIITNRLRTNLNRAANGRMLFVTRNYAKSIDTERRLKRKGVSDVGTVGLTQAIAGADYKLGGSITSLDSRSSSTGTIQRYNQIVFEMFDLERGILIWSDMFEFARAGQDDVVYR